MPEIVQRVRALVQAKAVFSLTSDPQRETLTRLIDFNLLDRAIIPLIVTAVDIETGEEVAFDSRRGSLGSHHSQHGLSGRLSTCHYWRSDILRSGIV
nr:hypothetical protein [Rhizobium leguminosarum]